MTGSFETINADIGEVNKLGGKYGTGKIPKVPAVDEISAVGPESSNSRLGYKDLEFIVERPPKAGEIGNFHLTKVLSDYAQQQKIEVPRDDTIYDIGGLIFSLPPGPLQTNDPMEINPYGYIGERNQDREEAALALVNKIIEAGRIEGHVDKVIEAISTKGTGSDQIAAEISMGKVVKVGEVTTTQLFAPRIDEAIIAPALDIVEDPLLISINWPYEPLANGITADLLNKGFAIAARLGLEAVTNAFVAEVIKHYPYLFVSIKTNQKVLDKIKKALARILNPRIKQFRDNSQNKMFLAMRMARAVGNYAIHTSLSQYNAEKRMTIAELCFLARAVETMLNPEMLTMFD